MPIHHTVLTIMNPQAAGTLRPTDPTPLTSSQVTENRKPIATRKQMPKPNQNHRGKRPLSGTLAMRPAMAASSDTVADLAEIGGARLGAEFGKHGVARRLGLLGDDAGRLILDVAEADGAG